MAADDEQPRAVLLHRVAQHAARLLDDILRRLAQVGLHPTTEDGEGLAWTMTSSAPPPPAMPLARCCIVHSSA
uniref:Uncharacterized protein n=1 Tax=Oryza meridionalis TaxID=40149 RepID=A0A0E0EG29_9ORYZ